MHRTWRRVLWLHVLGIVCLFGLPYLADYLVGSGALTSLLLAVALPSGMWLGLRLRRPAARPYRAWRALEPVVPIALALGSAAMGWMSVRWTYPLLQLTFVACAAAAGVLGWLVARDSVHERRREVSATSPIAEAPATQRR